MGAQRQSSLSPPFFYSARREHGSIALFPGNVRRRSRRRHQDDGVGTEGGAKQDTALLRGCRAGGAIRGKHQGHERLLRTGPDEARTARRKAPVSPPDLWNSRILDRHRHHGRGGGPQGRQSARNAARRRGTHLGCHTSPHAPHHPDPLGSRPPCVLALQGAMDLRD